MPLQYEGVSAEHMAVRQACGIFDVSHMGQIETSGPQALELLQRVLSNDVAAIGFGVGPGADPGTGGAQYSVVCREDGGVLDDVFTYRLDSERYLTVTNAANHRRDLEWFRMHGQDFAGAEISDRISELAMLAVQGPQARSMGGAGAAETLVACAIEGAGIARPGNRVQGGGEVTSGTFSPCLAAGIGLAYVPVERSASGTRLRIDVRGKMRAAVVKDKPLYRRRADAVSPQVEVGADG